MVIGRIKLYSLLFLVFILSCGGLTDSDSTEEKYNIIYIANGATSGTVPVDSLRYELGSIVTVKGNSGSLVKTDALFSGWNSKDDGTGIQYPENSTFSIGAGNVVLYAQWEINGNYSVTYQSNGATGGVVPTDPKKYSTGEIATVLQNEGNLTKTGFFFSGWNEAANGTGGKYLPYAKLKVGVSDVALFAHWQKLVNKPKVPTNLAVSAGDAVNTITFTPAEYATSHVLYWDTLSPVTDTASRIIINNSGTYGHTGLTNGKTYYYRIQGVNDLGNGGLSEEEFDTPLGPNTKSVYVLGNIRGGNNQWVSGYWKNKKFEALTIPANHSNAQVKAFAADGNDLYILGTVTNESNKKIAGYWKNDVFTPYTSPATYTDIEVADIAVVNGTVHAVGTARMFGKNSALYWKNNDPVKALYKKLSTINYSATKLHVVGDTVYVGGQFKTGSKVHGVYWNLSKPNLSNIVPADTSVIVTNVTGITFHNNKVLVYGTQIESSQSKSAFVWDGTTVQSIFAMSFANSEVTDAYSDGKDVYAAGFFKTFVLSSGLYWKNNTYGQIMNPDSESYYSPSSITVVDDIVYLAGTRISQSSSQVFDPWYSVNGINYHLSVPKGTDNFEVRDIVVK